MIIDISGSMQNNDILHNPKDRVKLHLIRKFRDFKLNELSHPSKINEIKFKEFINSKIYSIFIENAKNEIITGSQSLKIFGLLDRNISDLDIITINPDIYLPFENDMNFYSIIPKNYIGSKHIKNSKFDFFKFEDNTYIEYEGIKFEHPIDILQRKLELADLENMETTNKHVKDLLHILD